MLKKKKEKKKKKSALKKIYTENAQWKKILKKQFGHLFGQSISLSNNWPNTIFSHQPNIETFISTPILAINGTNCLS